jgi:hypothetical protein
MTKPILVTAIFMVLMTTTVALLAATASTDSSSNERATVEFPEPVRLRGVFLHGQYRVEHDEDRMAKGEDCTYIYNRKGTLVVSFHCIPVRRPKASRFLVVVNRELSTTSAPEIKELQFSGSTEAHRIP